MQYILTEEEYNKLKEAATAKRVAQDKKLASFCQKVADEMPIHGWHAEHCDNAIILDGEKAAPWGCVHSLDYEGYCDDCPCIEVCPMPKNHSK